MKVFIVTLALFAVVFADLKSELHDDAKKLEDLAQKEIAKLKEEGKLVEAKEIQVIEDEIVKAENQLESLNEDTEVGKIAVSALESVLKALESKLNGAINKIRGSSSGSYYDSSTTEELLADAFKLYELAEEEIKKLKNEGKTVLAAELQVIADEILKAENKLESFKASNEVSKTLVHSLEVVIKSLEKQLNDEIQKINQSEEKPQI